MTLRDYIVEMTVHIYKLDESKECCHVATFSLDLFGDIEPTVESIRFWYGTANNLTISDYRQKIYESKGTLSKMAETITVGDIREAIDELEKSLAMGGDYYYEALRGKVFFTRTPDQLFEVFLYCERKEEEE